MQKWDTNGTMTFWIISTALAVAVAASLIFSLLRGQRANLADTSEYDVQVYRQQLAEVERDVARGVLDADDAARARIEISRRILAADKATRQSGSSNNNGKLMIGLMALLLIGGSIGLYWHLGSPGYQDMALADRHAFAEEMRQTRPSQADMQKRMPPFVMPQGLNPDYVQLMTQLRSTVAERPEDLHGNTLLAQNEASLGNFIAAAAAQKNVLRIKGTEVSSDEITDYAEFLVMAAGGFVSPEAEVALRTALSADEENARAWYYIGLMRMQTGRPDITFRVWDGLLRRGPADEPWIEPIKQQIGALAQMAGVDYKMPNIGPGPDSLPGPTADDVTAADEMTPEDRMEMVRGMVSNLSTRLATQGGPPEEWARLINALGVLGETDRAKAIYGEAQTRFKDHREAFDLIRAAAIRAGVAE